MKSTMKRAVALGSISLAFTVAGMQPAYGLQVNTCIENTTSSVANDFHITLVSPKDMSVEGLFTAENDGSKKVGLTYDGFSVTPGQSHCFRFFVFENSSSAPNPENIEVGISESNWTLGGLPVVPKVSLGSIDFDGESSDFLVARLSLFDDLAGSNQIGTMWWEQQATSATCRNFTTGPVFASIAFARFQNMVALENLNESLTGFGADSPIQLCTPTPVPEPASLLLLGAALAGLACSRRSKIGAPARHFSALENSVS